MPLPQSAELFYDLDLTDEQKEYVDSIFDNQMTIVNAKAGTGKTVISVGAAKILGKPLIYTFAPIEEGALGYTPGTAEEKESKYVQPLVDALHEIREDPRLAMFSENNPDFMNDHTWIEAKSHVFMRGTNIKNSTLIVDEAQNMTRGDSSRTSNTSAVSLTQRS